MRIITNQWYSKDKSRVYQLNVGEQKNRDSKRGTLGPLGLIKRENKVYKLTDTVRQTYVELENINIIPQNRENKPIM